MTLLLVTSIAFGQGNDVAKQVYRASHGSVFLVYVNDSSGTPSALGSAFLVAPRILVTNAHVVEGGTPVLAVGPVRIPLKVLRIDHTNDLAILGVDKDLASKPLPLASETVSPGEQIFAIGNPAGLEKTISQGLVSGLRRRNVKVVQELLRHASARITMDVYAQAMTPAKRAAQQKVVEMVRPVRPPLEVKKMA